MSANPGETTPLAGLAERTLRSLNPFDLARFDEHAFERDEGRREGVGALAG